MTIEEYLEDINPSITDLRSVFAQSCHILGIRQDSCIALTLLLEARWSMAAMVIYLLQQEMAGNKPDTTEVVLMAEKIRDAYDRIKDSLKEDSIKTKKSLYSRIIPFGKNYIVRRKGKWGVVDEHNVALLTIRYSRLFLFDGGYAGIQFKNKWGLVNAEGKITIEPQYDSIKYYDKYHGCDVECGLFCFVVDVNNRRMIETDGKNVRFESGKFLVYTKEYCQLFNMDGTVFSKTHDNILGIGNKFEAFDDVNGQQVKTLINPNGEEVTLPAFETGVFFDSIAQFRYQNKYGIIDDKARIVVPNIYNYIDVKNGVIAVNEGGQESRDNDHRFLGFPFDGVWLFWDYQFKEITTCRFEHVRRVNGTWFASCSGKWYKITPEGEYLFAENENEYKKKVQTFSNKSQNTSKKGQFAILSDGYGKGDNRKLYVRACDGKVIRHYYHTPYLPMEVSELEGVWKVGDSFVNLYGQDMPNPHAFKMPPHLKPKYSFRENKSLLCISKSDLLSLFVELMKMSNIEERDIITLCSLNETRQKRAVLCEWLLRKYNKNPNLKFSYSELVNVSYAVHVWLQKRKK